MAIIFNAPWGKFLSGLTGFSVVLLLSIVFVGVFRGPAHNPIWSLSMIGLPLIVLLLAALFMIRGYILTPETLLIQRLGWKSRLDLSELRSVEVDPRAMKESIRTFGNGGLFSFSGRFWNKTLGSYRAFATDPQRAVVLKFADQVVVITPEDPQEFVARIKTYR